ncbi:hypothetical protein C7S18_00785 [Ahniella affigens]|uniref:Leucine-rich repeat domain-containing protein n=1 Tax=Ahniella affigens TaxID=2021234 RepID=A0A2P1PLW2_9GAMM|nr:leucine-rich repeat domain-containing protein [Ahniella affigens]AVP95823.1 hypothetical protein C7S18_00785 [Ahniella affigens]
MWKALGIIGLLLALGLGLLILLALNAEPVPPYAEQVKTLPAAEQASLQQLAADLGMAPDGFRALGGYYEGLLDVPANERAVFIDQGHVRALRVAAWPKGTPPDLSALTALQVLWLDRGKMTSLPDLSGLGQLVELELREQPLAELAAGRLPGSLTRLGLRQTPVTDLRALASLNHLNVLDASGTKVTDFSALVPLALDRLDLHDTLIARMPDALPVKQHGDWSVNLDNTPVLNPPGHQWQSPGGYSFTGVALGAETKRGMIGNGVVAVEGTGAEITAMRPVMLPTSNDRGGVYDVQIEASIESGRARIWLNRPLGYFPAISPWFSEVDIDGFGFLQRPGYVYADLEPGKTAVLIGQLSLPGPIEHYDLEFKVEPLGGTPATGLRYKVTKAPKTGP